MVDRESSPRHSLCNALSLGMGHGERPRSNNKNERGRTGAHGLQIIEVSHTGAEPLAVNKFGYASRRHRRHLYSNRLIHFTLSLSLFSFTLLIESRLIYFPDANKILQFTSFLFQKFFYLFP
jgi:hypothetical protein